MSATEFKPIGGIKSFDRLIFDLCEYRKVVRLSLRNGNMFECTLLSSENGVLAVAVMRDRFDFDYVYISKQEIVSLSINKDQQGLE